MLRCAVGAYLIVLNLLLFCMMAADKAAAKHGRRRTPETTLLSLSVLGGSVGGILGMLLFRHKTRKPAFFLGLPLIALCQLALACFFLRR